jgi:outer membrane protein TolC
MIARSQRLVPRLAAAGIGIVLLAGTPCIARATVRWTLDAAVATALENSPDARIARHRIAGADAMLAEARAHGLPQVQLRVGYTATDSPMMAFGSILNQRAFDFGLDFNRPGTIDNLNGAASVAQSVFNGGRVASGARAARSGLAAVEHDEKAVRLQLAAAAVRAYLDIRKADEAVAAVEAGVKAYEAAVAAARARFEAGQMFKADLLSLEVQLAQTRENLLAARDGRALAGRVFSFVLGTDSTAEPVELLDPDPALQRLVAPSARDYSQRPELLAMQERVHAAAAMARAARGARQPSVVAFASWQYDHGWQTSHGADSWMAGVAVDLNVFDGGATSARIRQCDAALAEAGEILRKVELGLALEVERFRLAHDQAVERISVTQQALEQAAESASLSRARFEEGALLTADLIGVEGRLIEARMRHTVAVADARIAASELRRAVGLPPLSDE